MRETIPRLSRPVDRTAKGLENAAIYSYEVHPSFGCSGCAECFIGGLPVGGILCPPECNLYFGPCSACMACLQAHSGNANACPVCII